MTWNPDRDGAPEKVLAVQLRRIGDAILVTPALDALRAAWPRTAVHLLTAAPVPSLFAGDDRLAVTWIRPPRRGMWRLARELRAEQFDLVLDFQSLPWTAALARSLGGYAVGFSGRGRTPWYHRPVSLARHRGSDYAADHKLDLLRAVGLEPTLVPPRLLPPADPHPVWEELPPGPRVALVPVSLREHKRWPIARFVDTAAQLHRDTGAVFVVAGGPGEAAPVAEASRGLGKVPHRTAEFRTLPDFAAFLSGARLFLGNDNGPRHLALALGVPTVAYFGTQNPTHWTPPHPGPHRVLWNPDRAGGRAVREDLPLVDDTPPAAAAAAAELLALPAGVS